MPKQAMAVPLTGMRAKRGVAKTPGNKIAEASISAAKTMRYEKVTDSRLVRKQVASHMLDALSMKISGRLSKKHAQAAAALMCSSEGSTAKPGRLVSVDSQ